MITDYPFLFPLLLLILIGGGLFLIRAGRVRQISQGNLDLATADQVRAELLQWIEDRTYDKNQVVETREFFKGMPDSDRLLVLAPLFDKRVLLVMKPPQTPTERIAEAMTEFFFLPIPTAVSLSPREYDRMIRGEDPRTIINDLHIGDSYDIDITQNAPGVISGIVTGTKGNVSGDSKSAVNNANSLEHLSSLISALREDAARTPELGRRQLLEGTASELEAAADEEARAPLVTRVKSWLDLGVTGLDATAKAYSILNGGS